MNVNRLQLAVLFPLLLYSTTSQLSFPELAGEMMHFTILFGCLFFYLDIWCKHFGYCHIKLIN